jgi:nucleotide-binding universal stress UspA family protein
VSFFDKLLRGRGNGQASKMAESPSTSKCWKRVLVPAIGRPYSGRGIEVACRLARSSGASVHLAYVMEIPRSLVIEASIPDVEALAASVLHDGEEAARQYKVPVVSTIYRTRNASDGVLKLIKEAECDLLVLGARPDEMRGLPADLTKLLFETAPCEVVLDYIAGEQ